MAKPTLAENNDATDWVLVGVKALGLLVLMVATGFGFSDRVTLLLDQGRPVTLAFYVGMWVVAYGALLVAAMLPNARVRLFWAFVIALTSAAGWAWQQVGGTSLGVFDVLSLWTARHEAGRAMTNYLGTLPGALLTFASAFLMIAVPVRLAPGRLRKMLNALFWAPAAPTALLVAILFLRAGGGTQAMPLQFQPLAVTLVGLQKAWGLNLSERMQVPFPPRRSARVKNIILLVDESVRADYLDFRAGSPVTPQLHALLPHAADFGKAVSGGNCSSYSNAILRFTAQRENMVESARTYPTLWQWAKKAGFTTVFIDGQSGFIKDPGKLQNFMTLQETKFIDHVIRFEGTSTTELDFVLLNRLAKLLKDNERPLFIYANKNGAHFPYDQDYPAVMRRFRPTVTEAGEETLSAKVNSYRNVIAWNVDEFFRQLLHKLDLKDTIIIYTADHAQNLDPARLPHCSTHDPDPREGLVPLLAITGERALLRRFRQAADMNRNAASHFQIAPTLLTLMGYDRKDLAGMYGPSLLDRLPRGQELAFSYGDIFGLFSPEVHWQALDTTRDWLETPAKEHLLHRSGALGEKAPGKVGMRPSGRAKVTAR